MIVNIETKLNCDFTAAVEYIMQPRTMEYIARPLIVFTPVKPKKFPATWKNGRYLVDLRVFGIIPFGKQYIGIDIIRDDGRDEFILRDNGYSDMIKTWDHWIFIRKTAGREAVDLIDRIEIRAGMMTVFIWVFANVFFRWRHSRWKRLVKTGFIELQ